MKFIAFFAFIAIVSATTVRPCSDFNCENALPSISGCGEFDLSSNIVAGAQITYDVAPAIFYSETGCQGEQDEVTSSEICHPFTFTPLCLKILCQ